MLQKRNDTIILKITYSEYTYSYFRYPWDFTRKELVNINGHPNSHKSTFRLEQKNYC